MMKRVEPVGPSSAKIMVIADLPSQFEHNVGRAFEGRVADYLKKAMMQQGIRPSEVRYTHIIKERVVKDYNELFDPKYGFPSDRVLEGLMEVRQEIAECQPNVVLLLGAGPLASIGGKGRWDRGKTKGVLKGWSGAISDWHMSTLQCLPAFGGVKGVSIYEPAILDRKWSMNPFIQVGLRRAREQAAFPEIRPVANQNIWVDPPRERWDEIARYLVSQPRLFFDIEYIGSKVLCISFAADTTDAFLFSCDNQDRKRLCKRILEEAKSLGAQNGMFDCSVLEWHWGVKLMHKLHFDTMLAAHAAHIELPKDLGTLCKLHTEQPCYWDHIDWNKIKAGKQDIEEVYYYGGLDSWVTANVAAAQERDDLCDPRVREVFEFEMSLLQPLWEISQRGILVDGDRMDILRMQMEKEIKEKGEKINTIAGFDVNVSSPKDMQRLLYEELGLPKIKINLTGPASDDFTLSKLELMAEDPLAKACLGLIRDVRKAKAMISKFVNIVYDADGRMRSHYSPSGTTTGRLASKKFYPTGTGAQGQNFPRDKRARRVFIADKGYLFFYNDLERAESLVVAKITGDPLMLDHHLPGKDAHTLLAAELFDLDPEEVNSDQRYMGKQTRHAGNYMQGWKTFMDNVNKKAKETGVAINATEAKFFIGKYRDLHVQLPIWWRRTEAQVRTRGVLYNLLGRPRRFYDRIDRILPTAIAYVPQSTVGDTLNKALLNVWRDEELRDYGLELLIQVHDAIGGQVPIGRVAERDVERVMSRVGELMRVPLTVPDTGEEFVIPVEIAYDPNPEKSSWGDVKKFTTIY